jgi:hypothetical protein
MQAAWQHGLETVATFQPLCVSPSAVATWASLVAHPWAFWSLAPFPFAAATPWYNIHIRRVLRTIDRTR